MNKTEYKFLAYNPIIRVMTSAQGGGYQIVLDVSESEWNNIKEINNPQNRGTKIFEVTIKVKKD